VDNGRKQLLQTFTLDILSNAVVLETFCL